MRILVTGCSGFLGGHLVRDLSASGFTVSGCFYSTAPENRVEKAAADIFQANLSEVTSVYSLLASTDPDIIIHAAALASLDRCEKETQLAWQINVQGTEAIVGAATAIRPENPPLLILISTDLVFDDIDAPLGGFVEETPPKAKSVYGKTKRSAEQLVAHYFGPHVTLRTSLICGEPVNNSQGFMTWLRESLQTEKSLPLFVDEYRTPIYVHDISAVVEACIKSWTQQTLTHGVLYHLGGPERLSRLELGLRVADAYKLQTGSIVKVTRAQVPGGSLRAHDVSLCNRSVVTDFSLEFHSIGSALQKIVSN